MNLILVLFSLGLRLADRKLVMTDVLASDGPRYTYHHGHEFYLNSLRFETHEKRHLNYIKFWPQIGSLKLMMTQFQYWPQMGCGIHIPMMK